MIKEQDSREQFERTWMEQTTATKPPARHEDGTYRSPPAEEAWRWWQASREHAVQGPLEKLRVNPASEPVAKHVYGEKDALADVVALSIALEQAKAQLAGPPGVPPGWSLRDAAQDALDWLEDDDVNLTHNIRERLRSALAAERTADGADSSTNQLRPSALRP